MTGPCTPIVFTAVQQADTRRQVAIRPAPLLDPVLDPEDAKVSSREVDAKFL
jgi:hypothetical protein